MKIDFEEAGMTLSAGQFVRVRDGAGSRITCRVGEVWVTQEDDRRDIILHSGESFTLDHDGLSLVSASEYAEIGVRQPRAAQHGYPLQGHH